MHPGKQIPNYICAIAVAPSAIALEKGLEKGFNKPRALSEKEIHVLIHKFALSAALSKEAGFTGVQIHAVHGYLISQFLSPRHNQRNDKWGGSLENRMRFVLALYHAIRGKVGKEFPIGIKLNFADFMRGGFNEEDSMAVVKAISDAGIDLIEISGGTYENPSMVGRNMKPNTQKCEVYFLEYAEKIRNQVDTPLVVTGGFRTAEGMKMAIQSGAPDLVGLGRPLAIDSNLTSKLIADNDYKIILRPLSTGVKLVDKIAMLDITWYEYQLERIAKMKKTKPNMSEWLVFFKTLKSAGIYVFRKLRAKHSCHFL